MKPVWIIVKLQMANDRSTEIEYCKGVRDFSSSDYIWTDNIIDAKQFSEEFIAADYSPKLMPYQGVIEIKKIYVSV